MSKRRIPGEPVLVEGDLMFVQLPDPAPKPCGKCQDPECRKWPWPAAIFTSYRGKYRDGIPECQMADAISAEKS